MCFTAGACIAFVCLNLAQHISVDGPRCAGCYLIYLRPWACFIWLHFPSDRSAELLKPVILLYSLTRRALDLPAVTVMAKEYSQHCIGKKKSFMRSQDSCCDSQPCHSSCITWVLLLLPIICRITLRAAAPWHLYSFPLQYHHLLLTFFHLLLSLMAFALFQMQSGSLWLTRWLNAHQSSPAISAMCLIFLLHRSCTSTISGNGKEGRW